MLTAFSAYLGVAAFLWLVLAFAGEVLMGGLCGISDILPRTGRFAFAAAFLLTLYSYPAFLVSTTAAVGLWRRRRWAVGWSFSAAVFQIPAEIVGIVKVISEPCGAFMIVIIAVYGLLLPLLMIRYVTHPHV